MIGSCDRGEVPREEILFERTHALDLNMSCSKLEQSFEKSNNIFQNLEEEQVDEEILKRKN